MAMMPFPLWSWGIRVDVPGIPSWLDEATLVLVSGSYCILYSSLHSTQHFISGLDIQAVAVCPRQRLVALGKRVASGHSRLQKPDCRTAPGSCRCIAVHEVSLPTNTGLTQRLRCTIRLPEHFEAVVSVSWSSNGQYLAAIVAGADSQLYVWSWERKKLLSFQKISEILPGPPLQVSINSDGMSHVSVTGPCGLQLYRLPEIGRRLQQLSLPSYLKHRRIAILSHTWLKNHRIAVATKGREIFIISVEFDRIQLETSVTLPELTSLPSPPLSGTQQFLRPLVAYGPGLACFMSPETVVLFQANDDSKDYKQMGLVKVPPGSLQDSDGKNKSQIVVSMCVSLSGDSLVIATDQKQLYILHLTPQGGEIGMEPIAVTGHVGPVSGLAVCARCPIVASCSLDGSVHVWSYKTRLLETSIVFAEQCLSLALHPSALFFAAGFSDKLRYFSILVDGPRCSRQLPVCACHEVVFSHGGHLLSAASENVVQVFCCVTFNCLIRLHGHTGKVSGLDWRQDDQRLGTVSLDGVISLWNLWQKSEDGASLQASEAEFKGFCFHSLSVGPVGTQYAVGEVASEAVDVKNKVTPSLQPSGVIVEVVDSQVKSEIFFPGYPITAMAIQWQESGLLCNVTPSSRICAEPEEEGKALLAGTREGFLQVFSMPLASNREGRRVPAHTTTITKMCVTVDQHYLLTASEDGCLFFWQLEGKNISAMALSPDETEEDATDDVLVSRTTVLKNEEMVVDLRKQLEEVLSQHSEQLQMRETMCGQQKRKITEHFLHEIKNLNRQCQILKMEKEQQRQKFEEEMADIVDKHIKEVQKLGSIHEQRSLKTHGEAERARKELAQVHELCTSQFAEAQKKAQQELEAVKQHFQKELQLNIIQHTEEQEILQQRLQEQEEILRLAEEDVDMEILEIKLNMELQLKNKQECNIQFKSERDLMRMKCAQMQQHADEQAFNIEQQGVELQHLQGIKETNEQSITSLQHDVADHDATLQDKKICICDLNKTNHELREFKNVLECKLREIEKQVKPREVQLLYTQRRMEQLSEELRYSKQESIELHTHLQGPQHKLLVIQEQLSAERMKVDDMHSLLTRFGNDLHTSIGSLQQPKVLHAYLKKLYAQYSQASPMESKNDQEKAKHGRQREFLEQSLVSRFHPPASDEISSYIDSKCIFKENVKLRHELSELRKELQVEQQQQQQQQQTMPK